MCVHCKKKVSDFPVPSRDVANQTLAGRLGTGKSLTFFYSIDYGDEKKGLPVSVDKFVDDVNATDEKV